MKQLAWLSSKGNKMSLPAPLKLTCSPITSSLFYPHKNHRAQAEYCVLLQDYLTLDRARLAVSPYVQSLFQAVWLLLHIQQSDMKVVLIMVSSLIPKMLAYSSKTVAQQGNTLMLPLC